MTVPVLTRLSSDPQQLAVPCCLMRGGSSRGGVFLDSDLPADPLERAALLLACYGSPDTRQIDGIGGADPLTSKAAVVSRSERSDADVEYTFYQVGIDQARVSTGGNCGNMLASVGPFALLQGLVPAVEPETRIRIYTVNTGQVVTARVPVQAGAPAWDGDCRIAGVPDAGARIRLDFGDCAGALSGRLLPTNAVCDRIELDGREMMVSLIDAATPFVFVRAADLDARGDESVDELLADPILMNRLEQVRGWAAVQLDLVREASEARAVTPNVPRVIMIAPPMAYRGGNAEEIAADELDLCVRQMAMQRPHRALAVTGAVCTAVAAAVPGSVVNETASIGEGDIRIGHPSGVMRVASRVELGSDGSISVRSAEIERTARLLMAGTLFARHGKLAELLETLRNQPC